MACMAISKLHHTSILTPSVVYRANPCSLFFTPSWKPLQTTFSLAVPSLCPRRMWPVLVPSKRRGDGLFPSTQAHGFCGHLHFCSYLICLEHLHPNLTPKSSCCKTSQWNLEVSRLGVQGGGRVRMSQNLGQMSSLADNWDSCLQNCLQKKTENCMSSAYVTTSDS
jgi:hypothetical protein